MAVPLEVKGEIRPSLQDTCKPSACNENGERVAAAAADGGSRASARGTGPARPAPWAGGPTR